MRQKLMKQKRKRHKDPVRRLLYRLISGQVSSFINDHPEAMTERGRAIAPDGIAKRILGDITSPDTVLRIRAASQR